MSCTHPIPVHYYFIHDEETGYLKGKISFIPSYISENRMKSMYGDELLYLPCGHCEACKLAYRKDWSVRCEMESMFHDQNCFVTLTLDDNNLRPLPVKKDVQYFLHKLRDVYGKKVRYFACGELGSHGRAHYHMILFGFRPDDMKFYGYSKSGYELYTSKFLDKVWNKGRVMVQDFTVKTASYVAGYVKKEKNQAFIMESTHPGLGKLYMDEHFLELFKYGHYQGRNGQIHRLPRYFKKLCMNKGFDMSHIVLGNTDLMREIDTSFKFNHCLMYDGEADALKGVIMKDKLKKLKRSL